MLSQLTTHFLFLLPTLALPNPHQITTYPRDTAASTITQFRYSGSGCTQNSNSVTYSPAATWSTPQTYTFKQFAAAVADTENCELHFQGAGLPAGWQVSVASVEFTGKLNLKDDAAAVQWFWQGYWSDDAADTVRTKIRYLPACSFIIMSKNHFIKRKMRADR